MHEPIAHGVTADLLGEDDTAFTINFGGLEQRAIAEIAHDGEPELHRVLGKVRQVQHVHGFIKRRVGIDVGSEGDPEPLHVRDQFGRRVGFRAVEHHVFEEMGHALLVVGLHQRTGGDVQPQGNPLGRLAVRIDDVTQPVLKHSVGRGTVGRDIRTRLWPGPGFHFLGRDGGLGACFGSLGRGDRIGCGHSGRHQRWHRSGFGWRLPRAQRHEGRSRAEHENEEEWGSLLHGRKVGVLGGTGNDESTEARRSFEKK